MKFPLKTVAACAVTAMAVGATSATAASMITSSQIKDGAVHMVDLSPGVQAKLHKAMASSHGKGGRDGTNGKDGANGADGAKGLDGLNGKDGVAGTNGTNGTNGAPGKDGTRWERLVGSCSDTAAGEITVRDGALKMNLPEHNSWAQFKMPVENTRVADINKLSFALNSPTTDGAYLKLKLEGGKFIVFQLGAQDAEQVTEHWVDYDVTGGIVRYSDAGDAPKLTFAQAKDELGDLDIKSLEITGGCANKTINGPVFIDDVVLNDEVVDFSWMAENRKANTPDHIAAAIERALRGRWVQEAALRNRLEKRLRELRAAK